MIVTVYKKNKQAARKAGGLFVFILKLILFFPVCFGTLALG
jgi:hypothetical protein